ncbi:MAG: cupin domain-containing protein [Gammaproteobacteria bacterium]|jgi:50S ribosomal protein L16 3-hydroxylase|nr:cupin domain-containing protein [Gammaproteobacteria bacterium]
MGTTLIFPDGVTAESFLQFFWQRRPLLMRGALPGIASPISPEELAGLACETGVESRLVRQQSRGRPRWKVSHGPFRAATFRKLPPTHWTLLVQDVDKLVPSVTRLLERFRFLPDWRVDDVMVSYAVDQGSVGPHWDEYDVFLIQARGRRRWQIANARPSPDNVLPDEELRIMARFEPDEEWVLEPGDVLYLPPGVPHWGVAVGDCVTCSVGYRAPSHRELASSWFEHVLEGVADDAYYRDGPMQPPAHGAEISPAAAARAVELVETLAGRSRAEIERWYGAFLTEPKPNLTVDPAEPPLTPDEFRRLFEARGAIYRHPFSRFAYLPKEDGCDWLFVAGESYTLPKRHRTFLQTVCQWRELHFGFLAEWLGESDCVDLLARLYNGGHLAFDDGA